MMKILLLLTAIALVQARPNADSEQTDDKQYEPHPDCPPAEIHFLLPHEYDCTKFYYCEYGLKWIEPRNCAPGTEFNDEIQVCVHESISNCTLPGPSSTPAVETTAVPTAAPEPTTIQEPATSAPSTEGPTDAPASAPTATADPDDYEVLANGCPANFEIFKLVPDEEYCHKFYYCDNGQLVSRYCAVGTYFNPKLQVCDWPSNVYCVNNGPYEYPTTDAPEDDLPSSPEDNDIGDVLDNGCPANFDVHYILPHETECGKFYQCVAGEKVERSCAAGTYFNFEIQVCDWPELVDCEL